MTPSTYAKLTKIFGTLNSALVDFYSDIIDSLPESRRHIAVYGLHSTLEHVSNIYRQVSDELYSAAQEATKK